MNVYRIEVASWPTSDGRPWPRYVSGYSREAYGDAANVEDDGLEWFKRLVDPNVAESEEVSEEFTAGDDDGGEVVGWILPDTTRRHYLSGSAARRWVKRARMLGAVADVVVSEPIVWRS